MTAQPLRLPALPDLPVRAHLEHIAGELDAAGAAVLVAPPGTGKTTLVPLALAAAQDGRVLVAEPRRLAARAAAARMAALLGEPVGETVGYAVRGDRKASARTRVEVVTSGLLLRRLAADPELSGVTAVVLDECHERHLDADLLLALLLDARAGLRPDLRVLATSATVATSRLAELLDGPVIEVPGAAFPVEIGYQPPLRGERIEACVARAVRALLAGPGDVLAFLPGAAEIRRTQAALAGVDADVLPLHGRLPAAEQDRALTPGPRKRIVLATAVAESSLTVPGVRAVVDGGLARVPRTDHRRGLAGLVTVRVSAAVADQRAGRAGREGPGRVLRCWPEGELLPRFPEPEIRTADLTRLALALAEWGTPDGSGLAWWDPPPEGPLRAGQEVLRALGALAGDSITERGRRIAALGLHPRLGRALLDGAELVGARTAAEVVARLDDDAVTDSADVDTALRSLRRRGGRWREEARRLERQVCALRRSRPGPGGNERHSRPPGVDESAVRCAPEGRAAALVVALAHPERLARRRPGTEDVYLLAGGTAVELAPGSPLAGQEWLAVAVADRTPGARHGTVRLAAAADRDLAEVAAPALVETAEEVAWERGAVVARQVRRLGAIVLEERRLDGPDPERLRAALLDGLRSEGLGLLHWTPHARSLRDRIATLHRVLGDPWPDVSDEALLADPGRWWSGPLTTARSRADLAKIDAAPILRGLLDPRVAGRLDELAPERIALPSGRRFAVDYSTDPPVLAVKLQELLGVTTTPTIAGGRLPLVLHLLSPAGRPAAVTSDLASFWRTGYPQVRAELRGRYPKHAWPVNPLGEAPGP
ncbi:ATP-dependent helicase HrpB [Pseudonocardia thermophila]|uniref:ATP-dependent helicase HrpB n=1 Tax=Pseudonocardia thermophila TaxID=1848 RepID=A0A1M6U6D5_PSETH|nr:ATP-dependent helicase HrpB [Pseudonocardia thermophila]SHK64726.1 ATP-dependent helicase HrpB [Pseudonocardia thermophila]